VRLSGKGLHSQRRRVWIGLASAELFTAEGATVVAADLDGTPYRVDVADEEETRALARPSSESTAASTSSSTTRESPASATSRRRASSCGSA
jgi:NAD(P)-dependent dehydrogenase (short-subunit alcohol dehydrogenase family)